jgi:hypothetical protein
MRIRIPLFICNVDPDQTFHFNADPDPAPHQSDANQQPLVYYETFIGHEDIKTMLVHERAA